MSRCSIERWRSRTGDRTGLCVWCQHPWEDHERGRCLACDAAEAERAKLKETKR